VTQRISAAEYNELIKKAGGNVRKVKLPEEIQIAASTWPTMSLGLPPDDPGLHSILVGKKCWCNPMFRAAPSIDSKKVIVLLSTEDSESTPGAIYDEKTKRWQCLSSWTVEEARLMAGQLLLAAKIAERDR
jgi:hypothetical protein